MRWKMFALMTALLLVASTAVSPNTVAAQEDSIVGKTRPLVVAGIGTAQKLELYLYSRPKASSANSRPPVVRGGSFNFRFTISPGDRGDVACKQTLQTTGTTTSGVNTLTLETTPGDNKEFLVNGKPVAPLNPSCFTNETKRVVLAVGAPPASDRGFNAEFSLQFARHFSPVGHSIVNPDGSTAASIGLDLPQKFLVFEDN